MPGLQQILRDTPNDTGSQKDLKANCIQTIGFLMEAVKDNATQFEDDAREVADIFVKLLQPGILSEDDPQVISLTAALT